MEETLEARLVDDALGTLRLDRSEGIYLHELNLGHAEPREVIDGRTARHGEDDRTRLRGSRAVTARLSIGPVAGRARADTADLLSAYLDPESRPWLHYSRDGQPERRMRLRASEMDAPITSPTWTTGFVAWRAPDGIQESAELSTAMVTAAADVEPGRAYDLVFDREYPESTPIGSIQIANVGQLAVYPLLRLYGPCDDPRVENQHSTHGGRLVFSGVTLATGQYLEVDMLEATVRLNGLANQSRYNRIDFAASEWPWRLARGLNQIRYFPVAFSGAAAAHVLWRPAWL